jgi:hypothetical protein
MMMMTTTITISDVNAGTFVFTNATAPIDITYIIVDTTN